MLKLVKNCSVFSLSNRDKVEISKMFIEWEQKRDYEMSDFTTDIFDGKTLTFANSNV